MSSTNSKWRYPNSVNIDFQKINGFITSKVPFMNRYLPLHTELCILIVAIIIILLLFLILLITISFASSDDFTNSCLKSHNDYRYRHKSPFLKSDANLISFAKERALHLVKTDIFSHPKDLKGNGENLHYITSFQQYSCSQIVEMWYNEIKDYDFANPLRRSRPTGHFTQVVWKESSYLGCAQEFSQRSNKLYTVCNYYPRGNHMSSMGNNVLPF